MITLEQAKRFQSGTILYHLFDKNADGTPKRWRVNGKVQTWKRDPNRIRIPLKHGLYDFDYLSDSDFVNGKCFIFKLEEA